VPEYNVIIFTENVELASALAADILSVCGCRAISLADPEDALAAAEHNQVELLLADLAVDSTFELLQQLGARGIDLSKVLVCPKDLQLVPADYLRLGVREYLAYPFDIKDVKRIVKLFCAVDPPGNSTCHPGIARADTPAGPESWSLTIPLGPVSTETGRASNSGNSGSRAYIPATTGTLGQDADFVSNVDAPQKQRNLSSLNPEASRQSGSSKIFLAEMVDVADSYLELLFEHINDGMWVLDIDLRTQLVNSAAGRLLENPPHQLIGKQYEDIWPARVNDDSGYRYLGRLFGDAVSGMASMSFGEGIFLELPSGRSITIEGIAIPIVRDGQSVGVTCIFREISVHRDVIQLKSELISMASHNLRTPLSTVVASLDYLLTTETLEHKGRTVLDRARAESRKMSSFLRDLLEISYLTLGQSIRLNPAAADLYRILPRITRSVQTASPAGISITLELPADLPLVLTDSGKLEIILRHILSHSAQRCRPEGVVQISASVREYQLVIQIIDSGPLLTKSQQDKIFWPLYPLEDDSESVPFGYAIGLYTIRQLVRLMGGEIWMTQPEDLGTCLSLTLPLWRPAEEVS
jgi:signal transduction histidine kinase